MVEWSGSVGSRGGVESAYRGGSYVDFNVGILRCRERDTVGSTWLCCMGSPR